MSWDWKEYVDLDQLGCIIHDLSGGDINLYEVDTGSDQYAIVISRGEMTPEQVVEAYRGRWDE
jgi:hypothetical protein